MLQRRLLIMVSSRNTGNVGSSGLTMAQLREHLDNELKGELYGIGPIFDVYLNEHDPAPGSEETIRDRCRQKVRDADIVLILYDGRAGWSGRDSIGICHIEMAEAMAVSPRKTRFIELPRGPRARTKAEQDRDQAFQAQYERLRPWAAVGVTDPAEIVNACQEAVISAVVDLAHADAVSAMRGTRGDTGDALDWSRMNYAQRAVAMITSTQNAFRRAGAAEVPDPGSELDLPRDRFLVRDIATASVLLQFHAVPAAMTVGAAREMVGQPFLRDHLAVPLLMGGALGPVHVIACARGVSEAQAIRQLGFPDATIIASTFGVYVADDVQKMQFVFLDNCRDDASTSGKVEEFVDWLERTREDTRLARRALARARIIKTIADEL